MIAGDVMTTDPASISVDGRLIDAVDLMLERRVSGLPVLDAEGRLVGMLTEGDLMRRAETGTDLASSRLRDLLAPRASARAFIAMHARMVRTMMSTPALNVLETTPLCDVVALLESHRIKRVPVLRQGTLVGIVSRFDLIRALGRILHRPSAALQDSLIRANILDALGRERWAPSPIEVTVQDGHVRLDGVIHGKEDLMALRLLAETTPGVRSVTDRLFLTSPDLGYARLPEDRLDDPV